MKYAKFTLIFLVVAFLIGCNTKSSSGLFNLPPEGWYHEILSDLKNKDFEQAEKHYVSFSSEHINSPLLEPTLLIMVQAYIEDEEYVKANEYIDEYIKRFGDASNIEFAQYLKIKANYESFIRPNRNQGLMQLSINQINDFLTRYPNSEFGPLVETMKVKFKLANHYLDMNIQDLYERTGKKTSAEIYKQRVENSAMKDANLQPPELPWYRSIFE
ncbi:MAG: outer membrane protein assembly factor BamD [Campylobacter sp.]|nr:outer membrane protein assembly factor BamD [Campylobacter sp.]